MTKCFCEETVCFICLKGEMLDHQCTKCGTRFCSECHMVTNNPNLPKEFQCQCFTKESTIEKEL
jgi:hypothetical protein